jgi:hypothetical protein
MPTYAARPVLTAKSSAPRVSSTGVSSVHTCTCHRSTWSTPSLLSDPSSVASRLPREVSSTRVPVRREIPALVAMTTSSRDTAAPSSEPRSSSDRPSV